MNDTEKKARKALIEKRIVSAVMQYFKAHGQPIAIRVLSAKFGRALLAVDHGFPECMQELDMRGLVRIEVKKSGAQIVYPGEGEKAVPSDDESHYF